MRPHLLELRAFGAFPDEVRLDLDALGESGLVLLCGDTGGGKTTLLDALGFALYGVVPGERQKARDDLRSHHAAPGAQAWVRLELTARGRRLRITRTPAQQRPKRRGEGTVLETPTALLEQAVGAGWEPVAQRNEDVGLEVGRLLGMDAEQFFQVVVLPQGRFAAFLQADHKEREKLLKQLFHVHRFESVERWLADRAAAAGSEVDAACRALEQVAARVSQQAAAEVPEDLEGAPDWAAELATAAADDAASASARAAAAQQVRAAGELALREAEQLQASQAARREAEQQLGVLEAQAGEVEQLAVVVDAARRARPVAVAVEGQRAAELDVAAAETQTQRALRAVLDCDGAVTTADLASTAGSGTRTRTADMSAGAGVDVAALTARARAADTAAAQLDKLVDVQLRAATASAAAAAASSACTSLVADLRACQDWLADLPEQRCALQERVDLARAATLALPELRVRHAAAAEQTRLAAGVADLERQRPALVDAVETATARAADLRAEAERLRNDRVDALVAELAFRLEDDCPCPVCGSLVHPDVPLVLPGAEVGKEAELAARAAAEVAERAAVGAGRALAVHDERLSGLRARLTGLPHEDDAEGLPRRLAETGARATGLADAEEQLVLLVATGEQRYADLARLETRLEEERKRQAEAEAEVAGLSQLLAAAGHAQTTDLSSLRQTALLTALACDAAAAAGSRLLSARAVLVRTERSVSELAAAAGFPDPAAAVEAVRSDEVVEQGTSRIAGHHGRLAQVRARLAELDVPLDVVAPVEARRTELAAAVLAHEQAVGAATVRAERARSLAALVPSYALAREAVAPLRERAASVRALAELAAGRGGNRLSMPLSTFVLAARLEEVAAAASQRLERMSGGRYTLHHTDAGRDGRRRAGLGLSVQDGWTGRTRDTATLSGGETFMTALSLALGLADVVTAEAGGQSIDALFVDEGFGTLDAGSLDQVMDVLDELRSGGRLVGVVSHVAELRQRIPAQVQVVKGVHGSTVVTT